MSDIGEVVLLLGMAFLVFMIGMASCDGGHYRGQNEIFVDQCNQKCAPKRAITETSSKIEYKKWLCACVDAER